MNWKWKLVKDIEHYAGLTYIQVILLNQVPFSSNREGKYIAKWFDFVIVSPSSGYNIATLPCSGNSCC